MSLSPIQTLQPTVLCCGSITSTPGQGSFTVPAYKAVLVTSIRIVNAHASVAATLNVSVRPSGASPRAIAKRNQNLAVGTAVVLSDYVTLGAGDKIEIDVTAGAAPSVDWTLLGVVAS